MKCSLALATILLACAAAFAQGDQSPQTAPPAQPQTAPESGGTMHGQMHGQMHHGRAGMHQHMQAHVQEMKTRIAKMRVDAEKVQDPATRAALLDQADMWEQMMHRMQAHMQGMDEGGMHHMDKMSGEHECHCKRRHSSDKEDGGEKNPQ